jgi:lipid-A-disaccharide synthase-like uncharacterized protein
LDPGLWKDIGGLGQALFGCRFVVQWIASERRKQPVIPRAFWYLSLTGGGLVLSYAIHQRDPVFIVPQAAGLVIYLRNVWLSFRPGSPAAAVEPD